MQRMFFSSAALFTFFTHLNVYSAELQIVSASSCQSSLEKAFNTAYETAKKELNNPDEYSQVSNWIQSSYYTYSSEAPDRITGACASVKSSFVETRFLNEEWTVSFNEKMCYMVDDAEYAWKDISQRAQESAALYCGEQAETPFSLEKLPVENAKWGKCYTMNVKSKCIKAI